MKQLLSTNTKTTCSINLPRTNCRPTRICAKLCYGRVGPIAWHEGKKDLMNDYLKGSDISQLIEECRPFKAVRLSAVGDLLTEHLPNLFRMAKELPETRFWGMTRKLEIARAINGAGLPNLNILVSVDASTDRKTWAYPGKMCFGPRRAQDPVPDDRRIITVFPYHFTGKVRGDVPAHPKDCPAVRHTVKGCYSCGHCWRWTQEAI